MMLRRIFVLSVLGVLAVACGGSDDSSGGGNKKKPSNKDGAR